MHELLKPKVIEHLQWLGKQNSKKIQVIDSIGPSTNNHDRHSTTTNYYEFELEKFMIRTSGGIGMVIGDKVSFEFRVDEIISIEKVNNELSIRISLGLDTIRLINVKIL